MREGEKHRFSWRYFVSGESLRCVEREESVQSVDGYYWLHGPRTRCERRDAIGRSVRRE